MRSQTFVMVIFTAGTLFAGGRNALALDEPSAAAAEKSVDAAAKTDSGKKEESPEKKSPEKKPPPRKIRRETYGDDIIPGPWSTATEVPDVAVDAALRSAQLHLKFGVMEHGNIKSFQRANEFLSIARERLLKSGRQRAAPAMPTIDGLKSETLRLQDVASTTLYGRFPLIRSYGFQVDEEEERQVHSFAPAGFARRTAIRSALTQIGKSASSGPLHVLVLVPGETKSERVNSDLAILVDSEARAAFADVANLMLYLGQLRKDVDPMPAWDAPDPAFDPICRQFLRRIDPEKEPRAVMLVMVREFVDESRDGYWVQTQQRTFEASSLEKAEDNPEKLEADKVRQHESLTHDKSRFAHPVTASIAGLFVIALLVYSGLALKTGSNPGVRAKWLAIPGAGFLIGLTLPSLIMLAFKRWLPIPETPAINGAWWPSTAGALSLILSAGVFRLVAGSAGRYLPNLYCHGHWGVAFIPVALGVAAAWIQPACYALEENAVHLIAAIAVAASLLAYCFGRAIDVADQFPIVVTPIALALSLLLGAGAFLGSPPVLWGTAAATTLTTAAHAWLLRRRITKNAENDEFTALPVESGARRPGTVEELRVALRAPHYHPPREFGRLTTIIEQTDIAECHWIGLTGPPAAGKTAAAQHFIHEMQSAHADVQILWGRCTEDSAPYQPFREALKELGVAAQLQVAQGGDVNGIFERLADELIPFWDFFSIDSDTEGETETSRIDLLAAVTNALEALSRNQPVVLFLDDIQWIDEGSAAVLRHLREHFSPGSETSLVILLASRDLKALETLAIKDSVISVTSPPASDQIRFLQERMGIAAASARFIIDALGVMGQDAGGMFWLVRAVRELVAEKAFEATPQGLALAGKFLNQGQLPVPTVMRAKLAESLRASGQFQPVLECAAVMGEIFRVDDLADCLGFDHLHLLQILRHLDLELQLVRDIPSDQDCYAFSSRFMLEMIREELGIAARPQANVQASKIALELHARLARVLERRSPRTPELTFTIAQHYFAAGKVYALQSVEFCMAAARIARHRRVFAEARRFLDMAQSSARLAGTALDVAAERAAIDAAGRRFETITSSQNAS